MKEQNVTACSFTGLGACSSAELGFFNVHIKEYRKKPVWEDMEVLSFIGNGSMAAGKPAIHAHGLFSKTDFSVTGGHIFKLIVSATCEVHLIKHEGEMKRELNSDFNLNLLV